jgi:adenylylsulfate kinase
VRAGVNSDLGFSEADRIEQARRMGEMARLIAKQGVAPVIVDFICPTDLTRAAFGYPDILIWVDRIQESRFPNTDAIWEQPKADLRIEAGMTVEEEVDLIIKTFKLHDWSAPTTLMLGRYQPWHEGHHALYKEAGKRTDQVLLGVRNTYNTSEKDPLTFDQVKGYIARDDFMDGSLVLRLPNITNIVYGRDVGYKIEQVDLGADIHSISATQKRKELGI